MKLFALYIGGEFPGANIELHDMRFVVAPTLRDTYAELRRQWWGIPKSLHIDCWAEIDHADGYDVTLRPEPFEGTDKLYFVNMGGYDRAEFTEKHKAMFVVAETEARAKAKAARTVKHWDMPHRDDLYEAEQAFCLNDAVDGQRLHIHLGRSETIRDLSFSCDYMPIKEATTRRS